MRSGMERNHSLYSSVYAGEGESSFMTEPRERFGESIGLVSFPRFSD